jgi:hypothetical protein
MGYFFSSKNHNESPKLAQSAKIANLVTLAPVPPCNPCNALKTWQLTLNGRKLQQKMFIKSTNCFNIFKLFSS